MSAPAGRALYAEVAVNAPLDHVLSYRIPAALSGSVHIGSMVEAPLRTGEARGVVTRITDSVAWKGTVKPLTRVLTPDYTIRPELMDLARWISGYYWANLGEALAAVAFFGLNDVQSRMQTHLALAAPDHWVAVSREAGPDGRKVTPKQRQVIEALLAAGNEPMSPADLQEDAGVGVGVINNLIERGWIERTQEAVSRDDDYGAGEPLPPPTLTPQQAEAVGAIRQALDDNVVRTFLLRGVTGSGKTEVYLRAIEETLRHGREAVMLVPEIALTPQTVGVFRSRLGSQVGVYHSRLSLGQKYDLWKKIAAGEVRVLVGARSAVFAPFPHPGLFIVDEEHESTYKQSSAPRYHARDTAVWRAHKSGAVAVLGSATPSLESLHNAREEKYTRLEMPSRVGPHASPVMSVVDMRKHIAKGSAEEAVLLSPVLKEAIAARLERGEQSVLLINRRGFANHVLCLACEKQIECPRCEVTLTYHKTIKRLLCHWCGHGQPLPKKCPACGEEEISILGFGTQRVEELIEREFPSARAIRIDVDTMKGRRSFIDAWDRVRSRKVDIILGTQMIAKGFHLESVTLVGVVSADFALFLPDFRAAERTFNLITQVAGRAGRGSLAGEVILQTFMPHHYAIQAAASLDAEGFYKREMHIRRMLRFPPLNRLVSVLLTSTDQELVREQSGRLANMMKTLARRPAYEEQKVLGPAPAPIGKIEDHYRWRILLRGPRPSELHDLLRQGLEAFAAVHNKSRVQVVIDVDPTDLL